MSDENKMPPVPPAQPVSPPAPSPLAKLPEDRKLTKKQKLLVRKILDPKTPSNAAAYREVYNSKRPELAAQQVHNVLKKPHVAKAITTLFNEKYPEADEDFMTLMKKQIRIAMESEYLDPNVLKLVEFYVRITGREAPRKSESKALTAKMKWPGSNGSGEQT